MCGEISEYSRQGFGVPFNVLDRERQAVPHAGSVYFQACKPKQNGHTSKHWHINKSFLSDKFSVSSDKKSVSSDIFQSHPVFSAVVYCISSKAFYIFYLVSLTFSKSDRHCSTMPSFIFAVPVKNFKIQ